MQKLILTILLTFVGHSAFAQTSFDEPQLNLDALDNDVSVTCTDKCASDLKLEMVTFESILKKPVGNARITSGYGWRIHPVLKRKKFHQGVDYSVPIGTPVHAAQSGTIVYLGWMSGYGNLVVIKHDNVYSTVYGHLNSFTKGLKVGSKVEKGQVFAKSGNTGQSTGPHLHYEIRARGLAVNHQTGKAYSNQLLVLGEPGTAPESKGNIAMGAAGVKAIRKSNGRIRTVLR
ncbi:hypothetical protein V757_00255 [Pelistega indica]|uniref:M23ase beta-sheet core domain-containing protein n=1 Tax=Pelistega indica TaxID=1414851 RepID=V8GAJ5_9BURK|nr:MULTISPECIES: M23 family metallopeptidase [Pelistega]ETD73141.1 hypothetical protein V757_00255 [Pelistega indica]